MLNDLSSIVAEFHDREDFVYVRSTKRADSLINCSVRLNVRPRGGEFLHE